MRKLWWNSRKNLVDYTLLGTNLDKFQAEVCTRCQEQVFDEKVFDIIEEKSKKFGTFGIKKN